MSDDPDVDLPADAARKRLFDYLQEDVARENPDDGVALMGYVMVVEVMSGEGRRHLMTLNSNAHGDRDAPEWVVEGWLHNRLYNWPTEEDDD